MKIKILSILIGLGAILVSPAPASADSDTCADRTIVAGAVRTTEDVQAFVQCAYEFVHEVGFEEARRAFNEEERWKSGPTYVFVDEMTDVPGASRAIVFPPDPSLEGVPWGVLTDDFGSDLIVEFYRVATNFGEGWVYYAFTNPATGRAEPKASYFKAIDWNGTSAAIGAGIYRRDLPASCRSDEVN
ncbi:MAG: cache domain-containing protein, partial [Acidobacteria bacterium]|nr:cache domain-containing protein [Acidobacteriota bacterium]